MMKKLFEVSAIPASALYQARKAAIIPKAPPARVRPILAPAAPGYRYDRARKRNAKSSVKNSRKKASVDLSVHMSKIVVKINHP